MYPTESVGAGNREFANFLFFRVYPRLSASKVW